MSSRKIRIIVLAGGLLSAGLSIAGDNGYLCRATLAYDLDDSGRLVLEKENGLWARAFGKEGISFSIDRDTGEMIGTGFDTGGGWSVKVLMNRPWFSRHSPSSENGVSHTLLATAA